MRASVRGVAPPPVRDRAVNPLAGAPGSALPPWTPTWRPC